MADIKKTLLHKVIAGKVYGIYPQTSADIVKYNETSTVAEEIAKLFSLVGGEGAGSVDEKIAVAILAAKKEILGIDDSNPTLSEAYDTIREIAEWIENDTTGAAALAADVASLKETVTKEGTGLVAKMTTAENDIDALESALNTEGTGLKARVTTAETNISELDSTLNGNPEDESDTGVVGRVAALRTDVDSLPHIQLVSADFDESKMNATDLYFKELPAATTPGQSGEEQTP